MWRRRIRLMKYGLEPFQKTAVSSLLKKMDSMTKSYEIDGSLSAVALTAPTGAGKTVISSAVIEGLFYGNDDYPGDDRAVILWLTDSPSLNNQTLKRFNDATDLINNTVMETITGDFAKNHSRLLHNHIYFLNRQLLGAGKKLEGEAEGGRSFYDVLNNTIEDPDTHLYLFIDEAHRGLGKSGVDKGTSDNANKTIYATIIDGRDGINKPMPCVVGISATIERFNNAMNGRKDRDTKAPVNVPIEEVRKSGLIKDTIELRTSKEKANTSHQDLTLACKKLAEVSKMWSEYCDKNDCPKVTPLLVVQVEDNVSKETLGEICNQIHKTLPWLDTSDCFANVFGEHDDIVTDFGTIPYVKPENVEEQTEIRVLFAKDAVSTGWDCPRAEVIYSRRKRTDSTYIAQLIGRMIRTPLKRRIDSVEELNSVACYLPEYDTKTVEDVVKSLKEDSVVCDGGTSVNVNSTPVSFFGDAKQKAEKQIEKIQKKSTDAEPVTPKTESQPTDITEDFTVVLDDDDIDIDAEKESKSVEALMEVVKRVPKADSKAIIDSFQGIITRAVRREKTNTFLDLWDCVDIVASDIDPDAEIENEIKEEFYNNIEGEIAKHPAEFKRALNNIRSTTMVAKRLDPLTGEVYESKEELVTNDNSRLTSYYKTAVSQFANASDYIKYYINKRIELGDDRNDAISRITAASYCMEIVQGMEMWAERKTQELLDEYSTRRYKVSEEHSAVWDRIEGNTKPYIERNLNIYTTQTSQNPNYDKYEKHIICDEDGWAYLNLKPMEQKIVKREIARSDNLAWYRNQSKNLNGALAISYELNGVYENMYPDFIFFQQMPDGSIGRAIVDPHGDWLGDAVAKLKGYVAYLKDHPDMFVSVQVVADEKGGTYRYLDLMLPSVQKAIEEFSGSSAKELFTGKLSKPYTIKNDDKE